MHPFSSCDHSLSLCAVREWCGKWQIHLQPKDIADRDTILTDIHNLCDTMRMIAVASIALLAERQALSQHTSNLSLKNSTLSRDEVRASDSSFVEVPPAHHTHTHTHTHSTLQSSLQLKSKYPMHTHTSTVCYGFDTVVFWFVGHLLLCFVNAFQ